MPDTVRLDPDGTASVLWARPRGADAVVVSATILMDGGAASQAVRLTPRRIAKTAYRLAIASGSPQAGYEKSPLRWPLWVEVLRDDSRDSIITDAAECARQRIVFRRASATGSVSPDTSLPFVGRARRLYQPPTDPVARDQNFQLDTSAVLTDTLRSARGGCWVTAFWTLGDAGAWQQVRATFVPGDLATTSAPPPQFSAIGRALPRLIAGYAGSYARGYQRLRPGMTRVEQRERLLAEGGTTAYDTTVRLTRDSVESKGAHGRANALVGMAFAPVPHWRSITMFAGVGVEDPANDWYVGLSLFRLARKLGGWVPETETLVFDTHLLLNAGRVEVLKDASRCTASPAACDTRKDLRFFRGASVLVALDAGSLLGEAFKRLIGS